MAFAAPDRMAVVVPPGLDGGETPVKVAWLPGATLYARVGTLLATGLHQVDNPVFGADGNLYVTYSGTRGQEATVSIFRITKSGAREPFVHGLVNPTSMALGPDGLPLCVVPIRRPRLSRVRRRPLRGDGVGSRRGVRPGVRRRRRAVCRRSRRQHVPHRSQRDARETFAQHSVEHCRVSSRDVARRRSLRVGADAGLVRFGAADRLRRHASHALNVPFGRPQGLAFDANGVLHVVEALAGSSGVYAIRPDRDPELIVAGAGLVGLAFGPRGEMVVASSDSVFSFPSA